MQTILKDFKQTFKNASICKSRGHQPHIRITRFDCKEFKNFKSKYKKSIVSHCKDTSFSSAYKTYKILIDDQTIPIVISERNSKVSIKDSILQKQLTPTKLNMTGTFISVDDFINKLTINLDIINPQLTDYWKSKNTDELKNILIKLAKQSLSFDVDFNRRESRILKNHRFSIGKDFGEILSAGYILKKYGNVTISEGESSNNFDLYFHDEIGIINKFNSKSGSGSGQSFKSIKNELSIISENEYLKGSPADIVINIVKIITENSKRTGKEKMFEVCNLASNLNGDIGDLFKDIKKEFFNDNSIDIFNFNYEHTYIEFIETLQSLLEKYDFPLLGIPKGTKERDPQDFYDKDIDFKLNIILFFMLTNLSKNLNEKIVTNIMNKLLRTKIYILHVNVNDNGCNIIEPKVIKYKFHYWSNCFAPTNNLLGFKSIY